MHTKDVSSIWIKDIPSNDFSGNIKEINSDNFVTQFEGKVTLKRVGKNYKMVWYVSGGEIVKKTILVPSTSTKTVTSKPSISAETTAYYQVYFNSSGEDEIEDTWDLGWLEEVTVNNNYGGSEPDYGYNGSGLYDDMGYYDPYSYGENGGDTYDGAGGGASSSGSSSSGGTDTDDKPTFRLYDNNYETTYPKFTQTVKNIASYVNSNDKIMETLVKYTGLTKAQILHQLTYGQGPYVKIDQLENNYGYHNPLTNIVQIDVDYVNKLENSSGSEAEILNLMLSITLLHELVHWTDGVLFNYTQENGNNWEIATYGFIVNMGNITLIKE